MTWSLTKLKTNGEWIWLIVENVFYFFRHWNFFKIFKAFFFQIATKLFSAGKFFLFKLNCFFFFLQNCGQRSFLARPSFGSSIWCPSRAVHLHLSDEALERSKNSKEKKKHGEEEKVIKLIDFVGLHLISSGRNFR